MKYKNLIIIFLLQIILLSCQSSRDKLNFVKEITLPYILEITDYTEFTEKAFHQKEVYTYADFSAVLGNDTHISRICFIGKFKRDRQTFVIYQNVTPDGSADFFPAVYITKIGENPETLCLTPSTEDRFTDKIVIRDNRIMLRENYWSPEEQQRKNDETKEYNFNFDLIESKKYPATNSNHNVPKISSFIEAMKKGNILTMNKECDLNEDHMKDYIMVFTPRKSDDDPFSAIYVLIGEKNGEFILYNNSKTIKAYYHDSYAEGFRDVAVKNNYFTIEENISSQPVQNKYTTFIYDRKNNAIYLHKLGFITLFPDAEKDKEVTYTTENFGTVSFKDYTIETIRF